MYILFTRHRRPNHSSILMVKNKNTGLAKRLIPYFGTPDGLLPLDKGKANEVCEGFAVCG
ncbi:MAG: hypothetical protein IJQ07_03665 [Clostridia bacterium]|nr:hypothetical protein [Clostridia bacterium]